MSEPMRTPFASLHPFPAERVLYARAASDQVAVTHRGATTVYQDRAEFQAAVGQVFQAELDVLQVGRDIADARADAAEQALQRLTLALEQRAGIARAVGERRKDIGAALAIGALGVAVVILLVNHVIGG
ncbi:hypothetical protein [Phenylobacterium sp.]|uniref:hypothetical protein n=1 Tax=Phenylobacterium sp. TaxID=1871053 RepID=UPI002F422395